jgi:hypothetical protein
MIVGVSNNFNFGPIRSREDILIRLFEAIEQGDLKTASWFTRFPHYLTMRDMLGNTPLHHASWHGQMEIVRFLVDLGADPNSRGIKQATPLMLAAEKDHLNICRFLLRNKANAHLVDENNQTALHYACGGIDSAQHSNEIVQLLLDYRVDWTIGEGTDRLTALSYAVAANKLNVIAIFRRFQIPCVLDPDYFYEKYKFKKRLPKVIDIPPYNVLADFFVEQKMFLMSFGMSCSYRDRNKKELKLDNGSMNAESLQGVIETLKRSSIKRKDAYLAILERSLQVTTTYSLGNLTRSYLAENTNDVQAFLLSYKIKPCNEFHSVSLVFSRSKRLLFKCDRGGTVMQPGMKLFRVGRPERLNEAIYCLARNAFSEANCVFFNLKIDRYLELDHVATLDHKFHRIGKCAIASSKLMVRAIDYFYLMDVNTIQKSKEKSRKHYKKFTRYDRLKVPEFLAKLKIFNEFVSERKLSKQELEVMGIVPNQVLFTVFIKCLTKPYIENLRPLIKHCPDFLDALDSMVLDISEPVLNELRLIKKEMDLENADSLYLGS